MRTLQLFAALLFVQFSVSGQQAPNFSFSTLDGATVSRSDFDGKVLAIFTFGYSCPSCIQIGGTIESDIYQPFLSNDQFAMLGIETWDGSAAAVQSYLTTTGITFPVLMMGSSIYSTYTTSYDRLIVIDANGQIVHQTNNLAKLDVATAKSAISTALGLQTSSATEHMGVAVGVSPAVSVSGFTATHTPESTIRVFSADGLVVEQREAGGSWSYFDVAPWPSGMYLIQIQSADRYIVHRFVKP